MIPLQNALRQLRLSGLAQTLDVRLQEAAASGLGHNEFLELILQDELNVRAQRQLERRTKAADFRSLKTLEDFDWRFNRSIKRQQIFELAEPVVDLAELNRDCVDEVCPDGLTAVKFFGIAGASGPEFCSCSIPCADDPAVCPGGTSCVTIADGPGEVCVVDEPTGVACGNVTCADDERCCDSCASQCTDINSAIVCPDDEGGDRICAGFACGELTCAAGTQYCSSFTGGMAPSPTTYDCVDFPMECSADPSCDCLGFDGSGPEACSSDADGNVTVAVFAP
jgi:hypothetical protein